LFSPDHFRDSTLENLAAELERAGRCQVGDAIERDGNRFQHYQLRCQHGAERLLLVRLNEANPAQITDLVIVERAAGRCARK
jgi:hypothetical protein